MLDTAIWPLLGPLLQSSDDELEILVVLVVGFLAGLGLIYWGWTRYRRYALIRDTPTSKVRSMAVGRTEIEGIALPVDESLESPFTDEDCLYAKWEVEEYRHVDDEWEWVSIGSGRKAVEFFLEDETGKVLVRADRGQPDFDLSDDRETTITIDGSEQPPAPILEFITSEHEGWDLVEMPDNIVGDVIDAAVGGGRIGRSSNKRRYTQTILPVEHDVYVFGSADPRPVEERTDRRAGANEDLLEVGPDASTGLLLISDRSEDRLSDYYSKMSPLAIFGGLLVSAVALYFLLSWYILA